MKVETRAQAMTFVGLSLIGLGLVALVANLVPGLDLTRIWPLILFMIALAFCLPPLFIPTARPTLAVLLIPASIFLSLGVIFMYALTADDWSVWAFAWTLIPAGIGLAIFGAARLGRWGWLASMAGFWIMVANLGLFIILGLILDGALIDRITPLLLIALGSLLLLRALSAPRSQDRA
jgi:hypothetical protein